MTDFGPCERLVTRREESTLDHPPGSKRRCKRPARVLLEQERGRPIAMCSQHAIAAYAAAARRP